MIDSEKQLYIRETEEKPNHLAVIAMIISAGVILVCWIANEFGIYHVDKKVMRVGMIVTVAVTLVPLLMLAFNSKRYGSKSTKYWMLLACFGFTLTATTMLTYHTELFYTLPLILAMLYRSKTMGGMALAATIVCMVCAPVLGYLLGTWDVALFKGLIEMVTDGTVQIIDPTYTISAKYVRDILMYIVLPKLFMIAPCAILMFHVISVGTDHVRSEIRLKQFNNRDALTGLYNQSYYKQYLENTETKGTVGVIFFDINGLKDVNDKNGHERGDLLIRKCAESVKAICDGKSDSIAFRLGGDEFLAIFEGADEQVVIGEIGEWEESLSRINRENIEEHNGLQCSMAVGYSVGDFSDIESLIRCADVGMYKNKKLMKTKNEQCEI